MHILISGASGLIGGALGTALAAAGHPVTSLVRRVPTSDGERRWDPAAESLDPGVLDDVDAVIHLAAESIAQRWTPGRMARILQSRRRSTRLLAEASARARKPPSAFLCASAIGYYGDRPGETLDEESGPGSDFLAEVCQQWEAACAPLADQGVRVVNLRFGMVLSPQGGALKQMLGPFRLGLGGRLGSGRQTMSWIALDDVVGAVQHVLATPTLRGPVNLVTPNPVSNRELTRTLGKVLRRPAALPAPRFALRLALGKMAGPLLLSDQRVLPTRLQSSGFSFQHPELEPALRHLLL